MEYLSRNQEVGYSLDSWDPDELIYKLESAKSVFFTRLTVKVYRNRISLEYRPFIGSGEHRETYSAIDVGNIYIKKSRKKAIVGAYKVGDIVPLFEIKGLNHYEGEELKDALDVMLNFRYFYRQ